MVKNIFVLVLMIITPTINFSQELITKDDIRLKSNLTERRESIPLINSTTNELSLFVIDRKNIYLNKYDNEFKLFAQQKFERPKTYLKNIVEAIDSDKGTYLFLLTNKIKNKFELLHINSESDTIKLTQKTLLGKRERFLTTFAHNNKICLIGVVPYSSLINIHKIDVTGNIETINYDLSDEKFYNTYKKETSLYEFFLKYEGLKTSLELNIVDSSIPNSIETTSNSSKLFINENTITISIDNCNSYTQLLNLGINEKSQKVLNFDKPQLLDVSNPNKPSIKSNSLLFDQNLYQIISKKGQMRFFITNLESNELVKQILLQKEDTITFKNTPIIQEGGMYDNYREMEKTQKFLRKISSGKIGISVNKTKNNQNVITLGSVKKIATGGAPMMGMGFGAIGGVAAGMTSGFMNPTFSAYISYANTVSTYINCIFDQEFNHQKGEVPLNSFDKLKDFSENLLNNKAETIFKYNNYLMYGYYDSLGQKYYLRKFESE